MLRHRSSLTLVTITVISILVATAAVVYAFQNILGTKEVSATVNLVSESDFLRICSEADTACDTPFAGDLAYGDMFRGTTITKRFHIKNTGVQSFKVDARIRLGTAITPLTLNIVSSSSDNYFTGDVPNLGKFKLVEREGVTIDVDRALSADTVRSVELSYTPFLGLPPGPLNFSVLMDVVDVVE